MVEDRRGGSANAEQSAWGPQSEKHKSVCNISDAISEIFPLREMKESIEVFHGKGR